MHVNFKILEDEVSAKMQRKFEKMNFEFSLHYLRYTLSNNQLKFGLSRFNLVSDFFQASALIEKYIPPSEENREMFFSNSLIIHKQNTKETNIVSLS